MLFSPLDPGIYTKDIPRQGQANHFNRYIKEPNPYSLERYQTEVKRLYAVLEKHLASTKSTFLVGEKCTIADIALWGWVVSTRQRFLVTSGSY